MVVLGAAGRIRQFVSGAISHGDHKEPGSPPRFVRAGSDQRFAIRSCGSSLGVRPPRFSETNRLAFFSRITEAADLDVVILRGPLHLLRGSLIRPQATAWSAARISFSDFLRARSFFCWVSSRSIREASV